MEKRVDLPGLAALTLVDNVQFWMSRNTKVYYGYKTADDDETCRVTLWGEDYPLSVEITPPGLPVTEAMGEAPADVSLAPDDPAIDKHVAVLADRLRAVNGEGPAVWRGRVAGEFLYLANEWLDNEDRPPLTVEAFAGLLVMDCVSVSTWEDANGVSCSVVLWFSESDDIFGGHTMSVRIPDAGNPEYEFMG